MITPFELNDLTLDPGNATEVARTASLKPLLEQALADKEGLNIVQAPAEAYEQANKGFGYLYEHHDLAARFAQEHQAQWVVIGRTHKASFLFVYFMVNVVNARTEERVGQVLVEVKGPQKKLTKKGVDSLARKIEALVAN